VAWILASFVYVSTGMQCECRYQFIIKSCLRNLRGLETCRSLCASQPAVVRLLASHSFSLVMRVVPLCPTIMLPVALPWRHPWLWESCPLARPATTPRPALTLLLVLSLDCKHCEQVYLNIYSFLC